MNIAAYSTYDSYKDSGVEWIGEVPSTWNVERGKWLFVKKDRPVRLDDEIVTCFRDGQVTLRNNRRTEGFTNALKEHGYQGIRKGDLVIHAMDAFAGAIGVSDSDGKATPVYSACVPREPDMVDPYFYAYYMRHIALSGLLVSLAKGIRERSSDFRYNDFADLQLAVPSLLEQRDIAAFLDEKCTKIDEAVRIKEAQIALLRERRQILIQEAVTRGLNPAAPMKDSGIDWIGQIPAHWEVRKLRDIGRFQNGISQGAEYFGKGYPFLTYGDVFKNDTVPNPPSGLAQSTRQDQQLYSVKRGDIFFTRTSEIISEIGIACSCLEDIPKATFSGFLIRFRPSISVVNHDYARYLFRSHYVRKFFAREVNIITRASLGQGLMKNLPVFVPPLAEQVKMATEITAICNKIDNVIAIKEDQITALKEYKTCLINAAVTGKIKVA